MAATTTPPEASPVVDLSLALDGIKFQRADAIKAHKELLERLDREQKDTEHRRALAIKGLLPEDHELAKSVIRIRGKVSESAEGALDAAVSDIAHGAPRLRENYIGAKRYEGFHQRADCEYGYGPKHGSIVFAVELVDRKRELTVAEREAAVKWLLTERELHELAKNVLGAPRSADQKPTLV